MKAPKAPRACKFHRNGDVTIWSVFTQDRQPAPDPSCYWSGFAWLVKGCPTCKTDGQMCASCAHDVLDN